jgi:hypothetical protein
MRNTERTAPEELDRIVTPALLLTRTGADMQRLTVKLNIVIIQT